LYKSAKFRKKDENLLEQRPFFKSKMVHIRRTKNHWSITVPVEVRRTLDWEKNYVPPGALFWLDAGLKNGALVVGVHDKLVDHELQILRGQRGTFKYL